MSGYDPDISVMLKTPDGPVLVHLAEGGEQFPWAAHKGRVITGPPDGTLTSDGTPLDSLEWHEDRFWVIEALNEAGDEVELNPEMYREALSLANEQAPPSKKSSLWG